MRIETAISLLGRKEPPLDLIENDDFAMIGDPADAWPCFVINRQETIQFRILSQEINAVILHSKEIEDFANLRQQIEKLGFVFEKKQVIHLQSGETEQHDCFVNNKIRITIPEKLTGEAGFTDAVTFELIT